MRVLVMRALWMTFWTFIAAVGTVIATDPPTWGIGFLGRSVHNIGNFCSLVCVLRLAGVRVVFSLPEEHAA